MIERRWLHFKLGFPKLALSSLISIQAHFGRAAVMNPLRARWYVKFWMWIRSTLSVNFEHWQIFGFHNKTRSHNTTVWTEDTQFWTNCRVMNKYAWMGSYSHLYIFDMPCKNCFCQLRSRNLIFYVRLVHSSSLRVRKNYVGKASKDKYRFRRRESFGN